MDRESLFLNWGILCLGLLCVATDVGCDRGNASVARRSRLAAGADVPMVVAVRPARLGAIADYYETFADLEVEKKADVVSRVTGVIEEIFVEEGDEVVEGTPVLRIGNDEYLHRVEKTVARLDSEMGKLAAYVAARRSKPPDEAYERLEAFETAMGREDWQAALDVVAATVVGYKDIGPAIVVVVGKADTISRASCRIGNSGFY